MVKGIAFDLEGTIIDSEGAHHAAHLKAAADAGVVLTVDRALLSIEHFIGGPDRAVAEEIFALSNKRHSVDDILVRKRQYYEAAIRELVIETRPGFVEFLIAVRQRKIKTAIGSLTPRRYADDLINRSGLRPYFPPERVVLKEDVEFLKPAPDVYLETARRMGIKPTEQLVFEDSPRGVAAAIAARSAAIGMPVYDRPETVEPLKRSGACRVYLGWRAIDVSELFYYYRWQ